jgi:hypothetical protein
MGLGKTAKTIRLDIRQVANNEFIISVAPEIDTWLHAL